VVFYTDLSGDAALLRPLPPLTETEKPGLDHGLTLEELTTAGWTTGHWTRSGTDF